MDVHEILEMFCAAKDDLRTELQNPFSAGEYTYATNGFFGVRVKGKYGYLENKHSDTIDKVIVINDYDESLYTEIPDIPETTYLKDCKECDGTGFYSECPECEGIGTVEWTSERGYNYEDDCGMCNGSKKVTGDDRVVCEKCLGEKRILSDKGIYVGSKYMNARLLSIINQLPGAKIAVEAVEELKAIPFKFYGGDGIIMPLRKVCGEL